MYCSSPTISTPPWSVTILHPSSLRSVQGSGLYYRVHVKASHSEGTKPITTHTHFTIVIVTLTLFGHLTLHSCPLVFLVPFCVFLRPPRPTVDLGVEGGEGKCVPLLLSFKETEECRVVHHFTQQLTLLSPAPPLLHSQLIHIQYSPTNHDVACNTQAPLPLVTQTPFIPHVSLPQSVSLSARHG